MNKYEKLYNEIRNDLIKKGYRNKKITLEEFYELFEPYKNIMSEKSLAQIIEMSVNSLYQLKKGNISGALILPSFPISMERKKEIKDSLVEKYTNTLIDYSTFLEIYQTYKKEMSEREFASILGIESYDYYAFRTDTSAKRRILKSVPVSEKRKNEVREEIINLGYANKKIDYVTFLRLFEKYKFEMHDFEFARILSNNNNVLGRLKSGKQKTFIVLKGVISPKIKEEKDSIKQNLIAKGYTNKKMFYFEIEELYKDYHELVTFMDFIELLGIDKKLLRTVRSDRNKRAVILKTKKLTDEEKQKILDYLCKNGFANKKINSIEFEELYKQFSSIISRIEFAQLIGISSNVYEKLNKNSKAIILRTRRPTEARFIEIREQLIIKGFYVGQEIVYSEFIRIFKEFENEMKEYEFAQIIGLNYSSYKSMKYDSRKVKILTNKIEILPERFDEIRNELRQRGLSNKVIKYKELLELYEPYKEEMTLSTFEMVLMLNISQSSDLRKKRCKGVSILPFEELPIKRKNAIIEEIKKKCATNILINYEYFLDMYAPYMNELSEKAFSDLLGMRMYSIKNMKAGDKVRIRIYDIDDIDNSETIQVYPTNNAIIEDHDIWAKEEIDEKAIYNRLIEDGWYNKSINYLQFKQIHREYGSDLSEKRFYRLLGMSYNSFNTIKNNPSKRARILRKLNVTKEVIIEIVNEIKLKQYDQKLIDYKEFLELYSKYDKHITENEFANILGISSIRNIRKCKARINLNKKQLEIAVYQLKEARFYSMNELRNICDELDLTVEDLLNYIYRNVGKSKPDLIIKLMKKDKIFIGSIKIPQEFQEKYINRLIEKAEKNEEIIRFKYKIDSNMYDFATDSIIFIIQNRGDYIYNSDTDEEALEALFACMYVYIKNQYLRLITRISPISLDKSIRFNKPGKKKTVMDNTTDLTHKDWMPEEVIRKVEKENQKKSTKINSKQQANMIIEIRELYKKGQEVEYILDYIEDKYNISKSELLEILTSLLQNQYTGEEL